MGGFFAAAVVRSRAAYLENAGVDARGILETSSFISGVIIGYFAMIGPYLYTRVSNRTRRGSLVVLLLGMAVVVCSSIAGIVQGLQSVDGLLWVGFFAPVAALNMVAFRMVFNYLKAYNKTRQGSADQADR